MKFKVFVCIALAFIVILQAAMVGGLWYAATKVRSTTNSIQTSLDQKTTTLNKETTNISNNLNDIKTQLGQLNNNLTGR